MCVPTKGLDGVSDRINLYGIEYLENRLTKAITGEYQFPGQKAINCRESQKILTHDGIG